MPDGDGMRLRLAHLYADVMNVYGDRGNAIALRYRCEARGIALDVDGIGIGHAFDPGEYDLLIIGGGEDREQRRIADDLAGRGPAIRSAIEDGLPALAVCGGFQLFGERYVDADGGVLPGIGLFRMETRHPGEGAERAIGNVLLQTEFGEVVGFENHGGRTWLDDGQEPFGTVIAGRGNNGKDGSEGARVGNAIGTYLHGSLLPKNPAVADFLLGKALARRYGERGTLEPIDAALEESARAAASTITRRGDGEGLGRRLRGLLRR
ncbi:MAG: glutamine amidotransferase [Chloroflexota bacterium]|nr:glutamine amidotransferase [Chloroflexota bacterium]